MKITILSILMLLFLSLCLASPARLSYGLKSGFNIAMHYGTMPAEGEFEVSPTVRPGFIGGAWLNMEILPQLSLSYELLYSMKGSREHITIYELEGEEFTKPAVMDVSYNLDYIEIPVLFKVKTFEAQRWSLSAIAGTAMSLKLGGSYELDGIVYFPEDEGYSEIPMHEKQDLDGVNMFDYSFVYGTALNFSGKVEGAFELRFTLGWDYLSLPTSAFTEPVELRNQTYSALIGFRF